MSEYGNFNGGFGLDSGAGGFQVNDGDGLPERQQVRSSLTPVTIKQILDATQESPDDEFKVNNVSLNMVSFIGILRKVEVSSASVTLIIEDGTGSIEVRRWIDAAISTAAADGELYDGYLHKYVFVGASVKEFNGKKNLQNATIYPIKDHNQLLYHNLSAIAHHLKSQGATFNGGSGSCASLFVNEDAPPLSSLSDRILILLKEVSGSMQEGVPLTYITQRLNITDVVGQKHCQELLDSGKIYNGYEDTTYMCF